jgi:hypothetical protein
MTTCESNKEINSNSSIYRMLVRFFLTGLSLGFFCSGVYQGFNGTPFLRNHPAESPILSGVLLFSRAEYERLKIGMPLETVEAILGQGIETNQSSTMSTFFWQRADNSKITATFERGKLKSKSQSGLK